jgi:hypothetical protein
MHLSDEQAAAIRKLLDALIDQQRARIAIPPYENRSGFWFGGGNMLQEDDGTIWLAGRYRNVGDSRTGTDSGTRGLELAIFRSDDLGASFEKVASYSKTDLKVAGSDVVSIEGVSLSRLSDGSWELLISTEKAIAYPPPWQQYQKPRTGVWTIDSMQGERPDRFDLTSLKPIINSLDHPETLHVKDPVSLLLPDKNQKSAKAAMIFCSHPFNWTSSNSGLAQRDADGGCRVVDWQIVPRGMTWDVAVTRITARMPIPQVGLFSNAPPASVYFYDGAECVRQLEENVSARHRPRGYSCEEIGGAFFGWDHEFPNMKRLSLYEPLFVSPHGTGCSRYVDVLTTNSGGLLASWQQSQSDLSQPLVLHQLRPEEIELLFA